MGLMRQLDVVKKRRYVGLIVGASFERNVEVAWSDEEGNEEQVKHRAYRVSRKEKPIPSKETTGSMIVRVLGQAHNVWV